MHDAPGVKIPHGLCDLFPYVQAPVDGEHFRPHVNGLVQRLALAEAGHDG